MSWQDFKNLIERRNYHLPDWKRAIAGNPNDPHSALELAIIKSLSKDLPFDEMLRNHKNIAAIILALVNAQSDPFGHGRDDSGKQATTRRQRHWRGRRHPAGVIAIRMVIMRCPPPIEWPDFTINVPIKVTRPVNERLPHRQRHGRWKL